MYGTDDPVPDPGREVVVDAPPCEIVMVVGGGADTEEEYIDVGFVVVLLMVFDTLCKAAAAVGSVSFWAAL
jgi:hypothetical protein